MKDYVRHKRAVPHIKGSDGRLGICAVRERVHIPLTARGKTMRKPISINGNRSRAEWMILPLSFFTKQESWSKRSGKALMAS